MQGYLTVKNVVIPTHELHQNILKSSLKHHLGVLKENALLITSQVILKNRKVHGERH